MAMSFADGSPQNPTDAGLMRYLRWRLRKIVKGY